MQRDYYDINSGDIHASDGKRVFVRLPLPCSTEKGTLAISSENLIDHLLLLFTFLLWLTTGKELKTVNNENIIVVPNGDPHRDTRSNM